MGNGKRKLDKQKKLDKRMKSNNFKRRQKYTNMIETGEVGKKQARKIREGRKASLEDVSGGGTNNGNFWGGVASANYRSSYSDEGSGLRFIYVKSKRNDASIVSLRYDVDGESFSNVEYGNGKSDEWLVSLERFELSKNAPKRDGIGEEVSEIRSLIRNCRLKYGNGNL